MKAFERSWVGACLLILTAGTATSVAQPIPFERFRSEAYGKWGEYGKIWPRLQHKGERRQEVKSDVPVNNYWVEIKWQAKERDGHRLFYSWSQWSTRPLSIMVRAYNPRYGFWIEKKADDRQWFVRRMESTATARESPDTLMVPNDNDTRFGAAFAISLWGFHCGRLLPDILNDPGIVAEARGVTGLIELKFWYSQRPKLKSMLDEIPVGIASGTVWLDPSTYAIVRYDCVYDVANHARINLHAVHTIAQVAGVPVCTAWETKFEGVSRTAVDKGTFSGIQRGTREYTDEVPPESDFTLEAYGLGSVAKVAEQELGPPPPGFPWHLLLVAVGVALVGTAFVLFRRSRRPADEPPHPSPAR
jgi:hypothetical protein